MAPAVIAYGCCVGWWDEFHRYVVPWAGAPALYAEGTDSTLRPLMALSGQTKISVAYNTILDALHSQYGDDLDAVILLHTDLEITDLDAEAKLLAPLLEPDVALVGVAGGGGQRGTEWWECDPIGHQLIDIMDIDFAAGSGPVQRTRPRSRTGDVDVLEGSLLAFGPWAIANLRFDTAYPGFHGYDEICLQARAVGKRNIVVDVDTHHHTQGGFKGPVSTADWHASNKRSIEKWCR